ncbi:hypothetical protein BP6252_06831 [Coleophoma cylindrospora]|uniref:Cytochrome P450 n=1 Tax=Coleophoma cylindrospora TaxID=1849047 RepID=A0A3D8RGC9_9HELO|nr:hypothetical protein BP6252_06831 [Coleophoma cylindrospora]
MTTLQLSLFGLFAILFLYKTIVAPLRNPLRHIPRAKQPPLRRRLLIEPDSRQCEEWMRETPNDGLIRYSGILGAERILVTDPRGVRDILQLQPYSFVKPGPIRKIIRSILGDGLVVAEGSMHKVSQRKVLQPAFKFAHIKDLYPTFWSKSVEFVDSLSKQVASSGQEAITLDIIPALGRPTLDIIGLAGFGLDFNSVADPSNDLTSNYLHGFSASKSAQLRRMLSLLLPGWFLDILPLKRNKELNAAVKAVRQASERVIQQRKADLQRTSGEKPTAQFPDILGVTMQSGVIDTADLINQSMTFLGAGQETTTSALGWAIYQISLSPEVQSRLREEIRANLPDPSIGTSITAEAIDKLPYLAAVCSETLRLFPPVHMIQRNLTHDLTVCNTAAPKGTSFRISIWALNRSPTLWASDPLVFNPERWLNDARGGATDLYSFLSFSHGPRSCIGERFARAEMATVLAALVGRFHFSFVGSGVDVNPDPDMLDCEFGVTTKINGGLWVNMQPAQG